MRPCQTFSALLPSSSALATIAAAQSFADPLAGAGPAAYRCSGERMRGVEEEGLRGE